MEESKSTNTHPAYYQGIRLSKSTVSHHAHNTHSMWTSSMNLLLKNCIYVILLALLSFYFLFPKAYAELSFPHDDSVKLNQSF